MYKQITPYLAIETSRPLRGGGFACVYNGLYYNKPVTVKELKRFQHNKQENTHFLNEVFESEIIKNRGSDCQVKIFEVYPSFKELQSNSTQNAIVYIVMEQYFKDLGEYLNEQKLKIKLDFGLFIINQIADGLQELQHLGIMDRNINPENVFLIKEPYSGEFFKLGDLGNRKNEDFAETQIGAISYMAPEMLNFNPQNNKSKSYIWALGVMAHEILTGVNLFHGINQAAVTQNILKMTSYMAKRNEAKNKIMMNNDNIAQSFLMITNEKVAQLIDKMLQPEPDKRSDFNTIYSQIDFLNKQTLLNHEQVQPSNQSNFANQPQQNVITQNQQQNRDIVIQVESQAEKDKKNAIFKKLEDQLLQTQEQFKNANSHNEDLQQQLLFQKFDSDIQIKQIESEKTNLANQNIAKQYQIFQLEQEKTQFIMIQGELQAEKEKQNDFFKKLEDELLQTQKLLKNAKSQNEDLQEQLRTQFFNSQQQINKLEQEKKVQFDQIEQQFNQIKKLEEEKIEFVIKDTVKIIEDKDKDLSRKQLQNKQRNYRQRKIFFQKKNR